MLGYYSGNQGFDGGPLADICTKGFHCPTVVGSRLADRGGCGVVALITKDRRRTQAGKGQGNRPANAARPACDQGDLAAKIQSFSCVHRLFISQRLVNTDWEKHG